MFKESETRTEDLVADFAWEFAWYGKLGEANWFPLVAKNDDEEQPLCPSSRHWAANWDRWQSSVPVWTIRMKTRSEGRWQKRHLVMGGHRISFNWPDHQRSINRCLNGSIDGVVTNLKNSGFCRAQGSQELWGLPNTEHVLGQWLSSPPFTSTLTLHLRRHDDTVFLAEFDLLRNIDGVLFF